MANKILLKRSNVVDSSGNPKLPDASSMDYGELAINYAAGCETLSIKNSSNKIVKFSSGGISDAPQDGKYYARKDGAWVDVNKPVLSLTINTNQSSHEAVANVKATVTYGETSVQMGNGDTLDLIVGTTYTITFPEVDNYKKPDDINFVADKGGLIVKIGTYKINILGVFIQDKSGELWTTGQWDTANNANANAIAILTSNVKVLLALTYVSTSMRISSSYDDPLENYMTAISDASSAKVDYNGRTNTTNIMKMQASTSYAAGACNAFTFPDGKTKGYLPSLGEWWEIYQNKSAVDAALSACGGTAMSANWHWSSTFWGVNDYGDRHCWLLYWSNGTVDYHYLHNNRFVRAIAAYE